MFAAISLTLKVMIAVESLMPGLNTEEHGELCSHLMRTTLSSEPPISCHQKNGGLSQMGQHPAVSSTAGFMRKGGDGTTEGSFIFVVNVNMFPGAETGDGKFNGASTQELFQAFKDTLSGAAPAAKL